MGAVLRSWQEGGLKVDGSNTGAEWGDLGSAVATGSSGGDFTSDVQHDIEDAFKLYTKDVATAAVADVDDADKQAGDNHVGEGSDAII